MARPEYKTVNFKREVLSKLLTEKPDNEGETEYLLRLIADGLRAKMKQCGTRPPARLIDTLLPDELFVLRTKWNDAGDASMGFPGILGSRYILVEVPETSQWYEEGKRTFLPVPRTTKIEDLQFFDIHIGLWELDEEEEKFLTGGADVKP